ncbi:hypothetical protein BD413DRAFT_611879 [Trametes elegans]|nr:hypothetical protein BD413DRAFT_611879 [Trametes elegans]
MTEPHFAPMAGRYAIVRLNPMAMVEHRVDPEASAQAQQMRPKKYLVYLHRENGVPHPGRPWYQYRICPIGPSLRPAQSSRGITPDMSIPIHPNSVHPKGRRPVRPAEDNPFPYDNCFHWIEAALDVRVRSRPENFNDSVAVKLPAEEKAYIGHCWEEDFERMWKTTHIRQGEPLERHGSICDPGHALDNPVTRRVSSDVEATLATAPPVIPPRSHGHDHDSMTSSSDSASVYSTSTHLTDGATFSTYSTFSRDSGGEALSEELYNRHGHSDDDDDAEMLPLVDLWLDLASHLKQEEIPSPTELIQECKAAIQIMASARARGPGDAPPMRSSSVLEEDDREQPPAVTPAPKKTKSFSRPKKLLRDVKVRAGRLMKRIARALRPPYILMWP